VGLFSNKAAPPAPRVSATPREPSSDEELEDAVDSSAAILRAFGAGAFDTDELTATALSQACEGWAQHLLVRSPPPDLPSESKRRQWRALARFVSVRRKAEHRYVTETTTTLRDAVWSFVGTLSRVLGTNGGADERIAEQLGRLKEAVGSPSPDELRREVSAAVEAMETIVRERQEEESRHSIELSRRVETLSEQLDDARREGKTDPLTRAPNRKAFDEHGSRVCDLAQVMGRPACVLLVDIDHFKSVNDTFGHPAGDAVLKSVADALVRTCRRKSDLVARYGGEEFAIVLAETTIEEACALAARVQAAVRTVTIGEGPRTRKITVSVGVAQITRGDTIETWVERSDKALYAAKAAGRDRTMIG
jgi:diguanylate cyclase (GGDEF)-like protein